MYTSARVQDADTRAVVAGAGLSVAEPLVRQAGVLLSPSETAERSTSCCPGSSKKVQGHFPIHHNRTHRIHAGTSKFLLWVSLLNINN